MSLVLDPPRRGRPRARNEILRAGQLAGIEPGELATRFGTPVLRLRPRRRRASGRRAAGGACRARVELAYAVKANPSLAVVTAPGPPGTSGPTWPRPASWRPLLRAGVDPGRVVMTGPGKRDDELAAAVELGVRAVTVESPGELARLERIAAAAGRRQPVLLRAAVTEAARLERVRLVGDDGAGKFGMDARGPAGCRPNRAARSTHLELLGLHAFGASNVVDAGALIAHAAATARTAAELGRSRRRADPDRRRRRRARDPVRAARGRPRRRAAGSRARRRSSRAGTTTRGSGTRRLLLEPGRFLVGQAGAYLARVVDTKTVDGRRIAILDGGVHHVLRPALWSARSTACGSSRPVGVHRSGRMPVPCR